MRRFQYLFLVTLFVIFAVSSCQCRKEPPPTDTTAKAPSGFQVVTPIAVTPKLRATATAPAAAEPTATVVAELPKDFPSEIPIYEGSTLSKVSPMPNEAHNVIFTARDSVPKVKDFYYKKLQAQGFQVTQEFDKGEHVFITFKKGELLVNLTVANDARSPGSQVIAVMYEREKPLPFDEF